MKKHQLKDQLVTKKLQGIHHSGQGTAIVLLHSSLSSSRQWKLLVNLLEKTHTVINIDILGYGRAPAVIDEKSYDLNVELNRIKKALSTLIANQKFHLVGHSCGGALALKLAVEKSDQVLSLSLFEPVAFHLLAKGSPERIVSDDFAAEVLKAKDSYQAAAIFTNFWNKEGFYKSLPVKMQALMAADIPKVNLDFKGLMAESYGFTEVKSITCPTLLMFGEQSPSLSRFLVEKLKIELSHAQIESFDCGHMGPVSHSDDIHPVIADFIKAIKVS